MATVSTNWISLIEPGIQQLVKKYGGTGCMVQEDVASMCAKVTVMRPDCVMGFKISRELVEDKQYHVIEQMVRQACGKMPDGQDRSDYIDEVKDDALRDVIDAEVRRLG